jgi:hypothetical protein
MSNHNIEEIDAIIAELTNDDDNLSVEGKRNAKHVREMWATIKACWADRDIRRMICMEHLRYQAEVKAGRIPVSIEG